MRLDVKTYSTKELESDLLCLLITSDGFSGSEFKDLDKALGGQLAALKKHKHFSGALLEQHLLIPHPEQRFARMLLIGLGESKSLHADILRKAGGLAGQKSLPTEIDSVTIILPKLDPKHKGESIASAVVEGFILGSYFNDSLKSGEPKRSRISTLKFLSTVDSGKLAKGAEQGHLIANLQSHCRDLSGCPSNIMTPRYLAQEAQRLANKHGLRIKVYDRPQIEKLGMHAFLAVAKGSREEPFLIQLDYKASKATKRAIVVGKGVTFDTGGISIKPADNMGEMRQDMTGAAVVLCAMAAIANLKPAINITAFIPTCENMLSGSAYKPGDVVKTSIGKTIEIVNTDAEGRLLLADVLGYATAQNPDYLLDVATLTGAATVALGHGGAAILSTSEQLVQKFFAASNATGEKVWQLPLWEEYEDQFRSNVADMTNSGGKPAGTITASLILKKFTGDIPWLHMDIAAVDFEYRGSEYVPRGPSGFGVRVLTEALRNL